jgi:hypothetical protein
MMNVGPLCRILFMLSVTKKPFMLSAVVLIVVMLNVVVPFQPSLMFRSKEELTFMKHLSLALL